ncbi:glutathione S-transferase C-terminal-like protein [Mycena rebaudengoi]|nr:glutathione S-transferase C-terminal-like protein [Mycena rebaudengoi]
MSSSAGTLWTVKGQYPGKAIRAVAAVGGVEIDLPASYIHREDNKKPAFLSKFPHGKIPAWEGKDGVLVFESAAIARYLAGLAGPTSTLLGQSPEQAAHIDQWVHLLETEVDVYTGLIHNLVGGKLGVYSESTHTILLDRQLRGLATLDAHIATREYFVGAYLTLADLYIAALIQRAAAVNFDTPTRARFPHLFAHVEKVINTNPALTEIYGPTEVLEAAPAYVGKD